jgi:hypothetical protein
VHELGAVRAQVHRLAPGRDLCDPSDYARGPRPGEPSGGRGRLPDEAMRARMVAYVEKL